MNFTSLSRLAALANGFACLPASAALLGMKIIKLTSPEPAEGRGFGNTSVLTDRYAVVPDASIPSDLGIINQAGCVFCDGEQVRKVSKKQACFLEVAFITLRSNFPLCAGLLLAPGDRVTVPMVVNASH